MGGEAAPVVPLEELRMASTMMMTTTKEDEEEEDDLVPTNSVNVRQLAELAAAAAHRKSLDQDQVLGGGENGGMMNRTPSRRSLTRRSSSGVVGLPSRSNSGLRAMSRSFGNERVMLGRTSSMHTPPSRRVVHRSASSDMSPMLSRSYARSGSHHRDADSHGADARAVPERGIRRAQSSIVESSYPSSSARHAPERRGNISRSDSARAVPSRRGVGRTCSQNSLNHMSQNGAAGLAAPDVGTLRPYRGREGLVNMSIQRSDSITSNSRSQQLNMLRRSVDDRSVGDMSSFTMATMDSVNLRKQQIVADPIDDAATYRDDAASFADHDSVSMATNDVSAPFFVEHIPERNPNHVPYDGVSVADSVVSGMDSSSPNHHQQQQRVLEDTKYLDNTSHSHPNQIACDAISLSTIGAEIDEIDESSSYLEDDDFDTTLHEENEFEEDSDEDEEDD
ncbi:hypothetical protein ACA910_008271 [Epithemia clementina (nom. ined.)]